jgi:hypothetical protein
MVSVHVSEHTLAIELDDDDIRTVRRTNSRPVRVIKGSRRQNPARVAVRTELSSSAVLTTEQPT